MLDNLFGGDMFIRHLVLSVSATTFNFFLYLFVSWSEYIKSPRSNAHDSAGYLGKLEFLQQVHCNMQKFPHSQGHAKGPKWISSEKRSRSTRG